MERWSRMKTLQSHGRKTKVPAPLIILPYREDSNDDAESGHIMGMWQPFPGFSRIGGSRTHYDSPYAIVSKTGGSSTFTFPSMEHKHSGQVSVGTPMKTIYDDEELPTPTAFIVNVMRLPTLMGSGLPTGAMLPHMRTKSQTTVIIGDVAALNATPVNAPMQEEHPLMVTKTNGGESNNSDSDQPQKRHWYNIRRNPRHSEGDQLDSGVRWSLKAVHLPRILESHLSLFRHGSLNHHNPIPIHTFTRLQWLKKVSQCL
ncbi:hypothetical protein BDR06DRAFT_1046712 [Suillus hirtellus]|nr:hypothetical protein BDR06DRAFT_1046712 [Suillus hirtellus]